MAIAGALVVPVEPESEQGLKKKLSSLSGVTVEGIGPKGIAIVLEADDVRSLKKTSIDIEKWDDVLEFELGYLNWE